MDSILTPTELLSIEATGKLLRELEERVVPLALSGETSRGTALHLGQMRGHASAAVDAIRQVTIWHEILCPEPATTELEPAAPLEDEEDDDALPFLEDVEAEPTLES